MFSLQQSGQRTSIGEWPDNLSIDVQAAEGKQYRSIGPCTWVTAVGYIFSEEWDDDDFWLQRLFDGKGKHRW